MNKKKLFVSVITIVAIGIFAVTVFRALYYIPSDEIPLSKALVKKALAEGSGTSLKSNLSSYPATLVIPKININANVQQVGITKKGNMATPNNFRDVGWYKYGTIPGQEGSAVIAGHLDNGLSLAAVFYNLKDLTKGDDIYVITIGNKRLHFIVTKTEMYNFNDLPSGNNIFTEGNGKFLKLITCAGSWVSEYKTHSKRLVVTAVLV